jgi:hypothetical protein
MQEFNFFTSLVATAFGCAIILACILNYIGKLFTTFATPAFGAFYYMESAFPQFKFNVPQKGKKKLIMEVAGTISTLSSTHIVWLLIYHALKKTDPHLMIGIIHQSIPFAEKAIICISIAIMLGISHTTKPKDNDDNWFDKITKL